MTLEERQTLQEKHSRDEKNQCSYCLYERYPCDVIKVLDATENLKFNDLKTKVECDHAIAIALHGTDPVGINFNYCPKCGEKL